MPGFDVDGARKAGYSDDEILKHLTESRKFDISGALKSGYAKPDLIQHLSTTPPPAAKPPEQSSAMSRFFSSVGDVLNPMGAIQEFIDRPNVWKAATSVPATPGPEREKALEKWMETPGVSSPMSSAFPAGVGPVLTAGQQARSGDVAGAAGTVVGAYGVLPVAGYGLAKTGQTVFTKGGRQQFAKGVSRQLEKLTPGEPTKMMTQALRPRSANIRFGPDMDRALPEIKLSEASLGRPITTIEDMLEAVKDAKKRVWGEREAITGNRDLMQINLSPVADAIEKTVGKRTLLHDPAKAKAVKEFADKYRGRTFTLQEAEELLEGANAELKTYYAKNPAARSVARAENPDIAALDAEAQWLRKRIYGELDQAGGGAAPRELSQRYGALRNTEEEIYRRMNVAGRQAPMNLTEQLSGVVAARDMVMGAGRFIFSGGKDFGGLGQAMQGVATRQAAKAIKELNTTNALIERTFRNYTGKPLKVSAQRVEPRALLGPGSIVTPPPADPSGITVTTGPPLQPRVRGLLPPAPLVTPPPADPSGVWGVRGEPVRPEIRGYLGRAPLVTPPPPDPSGITVTTGEPLSLADMMRLGYLKKKPKKRQ